MSNSILAYKKAPIDGNLHDNDASTATLSDSLLYNPPSFGADTFTLEGTYLTVEPPFLAYADTATGLSCPSGSTTICVPSDIHLSLTSPLVNAGDPTLTDPDGSGSDIGCYGGPDGDGWDVDGDGFFDYFWPGEWADAPEGFAPANYDCDDLDPKVQGCK